MSGVAAIWLTHRLPSDVPAQPGPTPPWLNWLGRAEAPDRVSFVVAREAEIDSIEVTSSNEREYDEETGLPLQTVASYLFVKVRTMPSPDDRRGRIWVWRWVDPLSTGEWECLLPVCVGPAS